MKRNIKEPIVTVLSHTPVAVAEIAARTCYDSFHKGNGAMQRFGVNIDNMTDDVIGDALESHETDLVERLVWVNHHASIAEHVHVNMHIKDISRGVLHHQVRHRMQNLSVRSTRYTMTDLAVVMSVLKHLKLIDEEVHAVNMIASVMDDHGILVCKDEDDIHAEARYFYSKTKKFVKSMDVKDLLSKDQYAYLIENVVAEATDIYGMIDDMCKLKSKRNVGDFLKDGVTDAWSTTLIATMNLRSLANYMKLRDSGAALSDTQVLANKIKEAMPKELLRLIVREKDIR